MADSLPNATVRVLRERIFDVLKEADLSVVSAKKIRTALSELPAGSLPEDLDLVEQKKAVDDVIRKCYDEFTSEKTSAEKPEVVKFSKEATEKPAKTTKKRTRAEKDEEPKKKRTASENSPLKRPMRLSDKLADVCGGKEVRWSFLLLT